MTYQFGMDAAALPGPAPEAAGSSSSPPPGAMGADASMGQGPAADPSMAMSPAGQNPYPTTDPGFITQVFQQLQQAQQADHASLQHAQDSALQSNPMYQALMNGSPMAPGAGQDGAGIGMDASSMPSPADMQAGMGQPGMV